jgi:hypothetical protein
MPKAQTTPEWRAAADEIWAVLKENAIRQAETDRIVKENAKQIGKLGNRFGEMAESMVLPNLLTKFNELGLPFTKAYPNAKITDKEHGIYAEVDTILENGDKVMSVEVKIKPSIDDVDDHIKRMEKLRKYADLRDDRRKYRGAIAGVVFGRAEKKYTLEKGFYVLEPSGETFNITVPAGSPHEW